jgi:hypothetical protein
MYGRRIRKTMNTALYIVWIECWYCVIIINGVTWSTLSQDKYE